MEPPVNIDPLAHEVPIRPPVLPGDKYSLRRYGAPRANGAALYVWRDVLASLVDASRTDPERFRAFVLTGSPFVGPLGAYVEVRGYTDLGQFTDAIGFANEVHRHWDQLHNRVRRMNGMHRVVGWGFMRPGCAGLPGPVERVVHRTLFHLPFEVTLALDPTDRQFGFHGLSVRGQLVPVGFQLVSRRSSPLAPPIAPEAIP
jgi:hypothetical protein